MEARASQRFDLSNISAVSSKSLYLSLTETMPPPSVVLKYPERDFKLIWSRLNSGVLCKLGRNILYLVIHERSWTKERGFRLNPTKYDTPLCPKCHLFVHLTTHKYASCKYLSDGWRQLRELMESIEPTIIYETDYSVLHLCFRRLENDLPIVWLLGQYLAYVEKEVFIDNRTVSGAQIRGWLQSKLPEARNMAMNEIGHITALDPSGIG